MVGWPGRRGFRTGHPAGRRTPPCPNRPAASIVVGAAFPPFSPPGPFMSGSAAAYLVVRRDDGFGEVFPLDPGERYTLGRAATNRYVLKDELCSREHAEFYHADRRWRL